MAFPLPASPSYARVTGPADPRREYLAGGGWLADATRLYLDLASHARQVAASQGDRLFETMLDDGVVGSSVETLKDAILADGLFLTAALGPEDADEGDATAADITLADRITEFCERSLCLYLDEPLDDVLRGWLDAIPFGCMLIEQTLFVPDEGPDAGRLVLKSLHVKPRAAWSFLLDEFGNIIGYTGAMNRGPDDPEAPILPPTKCALLVSHPRARDPRGQALLLRVYEPWNLRVLLRPQYWKYLSRFAVPSYFGTTAEGATEVEEQDEDGNPTGRRITAQEAFLQAVLRLENATAAVGEFGASLTTLDPQGNGEAFVAANDEFRREIVFGILQQVRTTLEASHSSRSDGETQQDVFGLAVRSYKKLLAGAIRQQILRPLIAYNFGSDAANRLVPAVNLGMVDHQDFSRNANAVARLAQAGMVPDQIKGPLLGWLGLGPILRRIKKALTFPTLGAAANAGSGSGSGSGTAGGQARENA